MHGEFLKHASRNSLAEFERSRLEHAANLEKQIRALIREWIAELVDADHARLLMNEDWLRGIGLHHIQESFDFSESSVTDRPAAARHQERIRTDRAAD